MEALGINIVDIVIYMVLFFILFSVINSKLIKPLLVIIEKRRTELKEITEKQTSLDQKAIDFDEQQKTTRTKLKEETQEETDRIITAAKDEAFNIIEKAKHEADKTKQRANELIDQERIKYKAELNEKFEDVLQKTLNQLYNQNKIDIDKNLIKQALIDLQK